MSALDEALPVTRRGARRIADVDEALLTLLQEGRVSTATHVEHMAVDQGALWAAAFPALASAAPRFSELPFIARLRLGGQLLYDEHGADAWLAAPPGEVDTIRAWRAFAVGAATLALADRLSEIRNFAVDDHFAVREWAWLAVRDAVCAEPAQAVSLVLDSSAWPDARWRRFASEVTRPRSVWGRNLRMFKLQPWLAEPLLDLLLVDADRYVLVSATNWLNDVSITHGQWVLRTCERVIRPCPPDSRWLLRRSTRAARRRSPASEPP